MRPDQHRVRRATSWAPGQTVGHACLPRAHADAAMMLRSNGTSAASSVTTSPKPSAIRSSQKTCRVTWADQDLLAPRTPSCTPTWDSKEPRILREANGPLECRFQPVDRSCSAPPTSKRPKITLHAPVPSPPRRSPEAPPLRRPPHQESGLPLSHVGQRLLGPWRPVHHALYANDLRKLRAQTHACGAPWLLDGVVDAEGHFDSALPPALCQHLFQVQALLTHTRTRIHTWFPNKTYLETTVRAFVYRWREMSGTEKCSAAGQPSQDAVPNAETRAAFLQLYRWFEQHPGANRCVTHEYGDKVQYGHTRKDVFEGDRTNPALAHEPCMVLTAIAQTCAEAYLSDERTALVLAWVRPQIERAATLAQLKEPCHEPPHVLYKHMPMTKAVMVEFLTTLMNVLGICSPPAVARQLGGVPADGRVPITGTMIPWLDGVITLHELGPFDPVLAAQNPAVVQAFILRNWFSKFVGDLENWAGQFLISAKGGMPYSEVIAIDPDEAFSNETIDHFMGILLGLPFFHLKDVTTDECRWVAKEFDFDEPIGWSKESYDCRHSIFGQLIRAYVLGFIDIDMRPIKEHLAILKSLPLSILRQIITPYVIAAAKDNKGKVPIQASDTFMLPEDFLSALIKRFSASLDQFPMFLDQLTIAREQQGDNPMYQFYAAMEPSRLNPPAADPVGRPQVGTAAKISA